MTYIHIVIEAQTIDNRLTRTYITFLFYVLLISFHEVIHAVLSSFCAINVSNFSSILCSKKYKDVFDNTLIC